MMQTIFGKKGQQERELEKDRYMQAQLHLLQSKLQRLERIFSVGMPLSEAEETIERLDKIEKGIKVVDSKVGMFANVLRDVKEELDKATKSLDNKASINQLQIISQRIKFLENIYGELSSTKTKDIFLNIVDILKNLENRIKVMEDIAHKNVSLLFKRELARVEEKAEREGKELPTGGAALRGKPPETAVAEKAIEEELNLSEKIKRFFRRIVGRK